MASILSVLVYKRDILLPLDAIFKCIHASKDCQYIKYNPGFSRDTFYRFYTEKRQKWKKNNFLKISEILKYSRELGRREQIAIVVNKSFHSDQKNIHIILSKNGSITVNGSFKAAVDVKVLDSC